LGGSGDSSRRLLLGAHRQAGRGRRSAQHGCPGRAQPNTPVDRGRPGGPPRPHRVRAIRGRCRRTLQRPRLGV
jgi:hypothetical protein